MVELPTTGLDVRLHFHGLPLLWVLEVCCVYPGVVPGCETFQGRIAFLQTYGFVDPHSRLGRNLDATCAVRRPGRAQARRPAFPGITASSTRPDRCQQT